MTEPWPRDTRRGFVRRPVGGPAHLEAHRMNPSALDPNVRQDLVARVRLEILAGTYDTPDKLDEAIDRLADRLCID